MQLHENTTFQKQDYTTTPLPLGEYEGCEFIECQFTGSDLSRIKFIDCAFRKCNLSMVKVAETGMQNIHFFDSKLHGIQWHHCSSFLFEVAFQNCLLNFCSFTRMKMKKTHFEESNLEEVDFTEADLTESIFDNCELRGSIFQRTILEKTDFTTATGYALDPEENRIKHARFSLEGTPGLLAKYDIIVK